MKTPNLKAVHALLDVMRHAPMALATDYGSTVSGPDGGYAAPVDVAKSIIAPEVGALLSYCSQLPVTKGGSIRLPVDIDTAFASGSSIVAAWEEEAEQHTQHKLKLNLEQFQLKKLIALVPVTDELINDAPALAAYLPLALQTAVTRKVNEAIINGGGAGVPLGILKSGAVIAVAKDGAQTAATITDQNIKDMLKRSLDPMNSIWAMNPAAYSQAIGLSSFDSASRTLAGLPIVTTDACPALGSEGDIILADMTRYLAAMKDPALHQSMHLWFDQDLTAFKLIFRMDGQPMLAAPITPQNSSVTKSYFVTLAERA